MGVQKVPASMIDPAVSNGTEGAGTTTLTMASNPNQLTTLSAARTYVLPTTGVPAGYSISITNLGDFALTIQSSNGDVVATLHVGTIWLMAGVATPTTKANWIVEYIRSKTTVNTTFTFDGSGGTSGAVDMVLERVGHFVHIWIPAMNAISGTSSTGLTSNTAIPAAFRLASSTPLAFNAVRNNAAPTADAGVIYPQTNGTIIVQRNQGGTAFSNSAGGGMQNNFVGVYYAPLP